MNRRHFLRGLLVTSALTAASRIPLSAASEPVEDPFRLLTDAEILEDLQAVMAMVPRHMAIALGVPHHILVGGRLEPVGGDNCRCALGLRNDPYSTEIFQKFVKELWSRAEDRHGQ